MTSNKTPTQGPLVGVDHGAKRIGLAVSDSGQSIAVPKLSLQGVGSGPGDAARVCRWALEQDAVGLIVGLPLNMDGTESAQTVVAKRFADHLARASDLPVELSDERLSSFQSDELMQQANVPASKRRALRDAFAAQVILQAFLDLRRRARDGH